MGACSCWRRGKTFCSPEACRCQGPCGRVAATPEGSSPAAVAPHLNPVDIDGVGSLHSDEGIGTVSLWPGEEGGLDTDGLSDTSDSVTHDRDVEEGQYYDFSVDSDSDGGEATLEDFYQDGL